MKTICMLLVCLAVARTSASLQAPRTKRDAPAPEAGHSSYSSFDASGSSASSYGASGYGNYYYHPTVEEEPEPEEEKKCVVKKLLPTLILIDIFLGIIAGVLIGLIPPLKFPNQWFGLVNSVLPVPGGGRGMMNDEVVGMVSNAIETDECLPRFMCEAGKYAKGRSGMLIALDLVTPSHFEGNMKVFQESALHKTNCKTFACPYLDGALTPSTLTKWITTATSIFPKWQNSSALI